MAGRTISEKILARKSGQDVHAGDLVVCEVDCALGTNGSVPMALGAGIPAVMARSFSRTYYRNAINNGLPPLVCYTISIRDGDILISDGTGAIRNERTGATLRPESLPPIMKAILSAGGSVPYTRQNGDFKL
jgi:3-isopropylmalate/(R)-2-methylmalate dehydratase small subunit